MIKISEDLEKRLIARLEQILNTKKGDITLTHKNGKKEDLIVGLSGDAVAIYNTEPDLIRMFEVEGPGARAVNIADAAIWLYKRSFEEEITR